MTNIQTIRTNKTNTTLHTSKSRFRRVAWVSLATVVTSLAVIGYLGVLEARAIDSRLVNACTHALAGKCFHAGELPQPLEGIGTLLDATSWCALQTDLFCDIAECTDRVAVLAGLLDSSTTGDPCLP